MAIISLLVSILLPSLNRAKQLAAQISCMSRLRNIGTATQLYAEEWDGAIGVHWLNGGEFVWHYFLRYGCPGGYLDNWQEAARCPSNPLTSGEYDSPWVGYGVHRWPINPGWYYPPDPGVSYWNQQIMKLHEVDQAADQLHYADTGGPGLCQWYFFKLNEPGQGRGIFPRHLASADIWFLDAHVESCTIDKLEQLGVLFCFDEDGNEIWF